MTTFVFVRHGVTAHTNKKLSGWMPKLHLTDEGKAQAAAAGERLAGFKLDAIYSSPILRTVETARAIAAHHDLDVVIRRGIGEVHYGGWEDRSLKSLARTKLWVTVQRFPSAARFPDGESLREVQARALEEIDRIREEHPKGTVCCVSHGDVIRLVAAHYLGVHIDLFQRIMIGPASISVIAVGQQGPVVLSLNAAPPPSDARTLAGAQKRRA
ncbi:MAG: MSMEG_4193 family putative phosphomutase [Actinobacteria bacterium]|jgi:probable phosphoglycerate mutase|nr:MSMEG_4193 family putative phosphomutase [Actinomycetota bacterium]